MITMKVDMGDGCTVEVGDGMIVRVHPDGTREVLQDFRPLIAASERRMAAALAQVQSMSNCLQDINIESPKERRIRLFTSAIERYGDKRRTLQDPRKR
jgi:hypothetical protein